MKKIFTKQNLPILIAAAAILVSLIVGTVFIVLAANGVFRPSPDDTSTTAPGGSTGAGNTYEDPDNKNWTDPVA